MALETNSQRLSDRIFSSFLLPGCEGSFFKCEITVRAVPENEAVRIANLTLAEPAETAGCPDRCSGESLRGCTALLLSKNVVRSVSYPLLPITRTT